MDRFKATYKYQLSTAGHLPLAPVYSRGRSRRLPVEQPSSPTASEGPKSESLFPLKVVTSGRPQTCLQSEDKATQNARTPPVAPAWNPSRRRRFALSFSTTKNTGSL